MQSKNSKFSVLFLAVLLMCLSASAAFGLTPSEQKLEELVWVGPDHTLVDTINKLGERIQKNPYSSFDHYLLSYAYIRLFNTEPTNLSLVKKANDLAQQSIELEPKSDYGTIALANLLSFMGQPARAIKYVGEVMEAGLTPNSWRIYLLLGQLNEDISDINIQLGFYKKAIKTKDAPKKIIVPHIIEKLKTAHSGEQLTRHLLQWNDEFESPHFLQEIAVSYAQTQKHQAAHKIFRKLNAGKHKSVATLTNHAILLYQNLNRPTESLRNLKKAQRLLSPDDSYRANIINLHIGSTYLKLRNFKKARQVYKKLLIDHEMQSDMSALIKNSFKSLGKEKVYLSLLKDISAETGSARLYIDIGKTADELNLHVDAIDAFRKAIILNPKSGETYNLLGLSLYKQKSYGEALQQFDTATKILPTNPSAHYNKACMLSILQRGSEALSALENAFILDPELKGNAKTDSDLNNIKGMPGYKKLLAPQVVAH